MYSKLLFQQAYRLNSLFIILLFTVVIYGIALFFTIPTTSFGEDDSSYFQTLSVEGVKDEIEINQQILNHPRVDQKSREESLAELQVLRERLNTLQNDLGDTETDTVRRRMIDGSLQDIDRLLSQHGLSDNGTADNTAIKNPTDETLAVTEALEDIRSYVEEIEGRITSMNEKYDNFGHRADATIARALSERGVAPGYAGSSGQWLGLSYSYTRDRFYSGHIGHLRNSIEGIRQKGSIAQEDISYINRGMADWRSREAELLALYEQSVSLRADRAKNGQEKGILNKEIDVVVRELYAKGNDAYNRWREDPRIRERQTRIGELEALNKQLGDQLSETDTKIARIRDAVVFSWIGDEGRVSVSRQRDDHVACGEDSPAEETPAAETPQESASSTWEDEEGTHTLVKLSDGSEIRTLERPDGTTVTVETKADGTTIETTEFSDGTSQTVTTATDPATGNIMVTTVSPDGRTAVVVKDTSGNIIRTGKQMWNGMRFTETSTDENGRMIEVVETPNGRTSTTVTDPEGGYGTETITASDGRVISQKDFTVTTGTDENGNTVTTKFYDGFDWGEQVVTGPDGSTIERRDVEKSPEDRGRHIYNRQREDLGLSAGWDNLPQDTRDEYNREHDRLAEKRQHEEEDQRSRDMADRRSDRTEEESRRRNEDVMERADAEYQARIEEIERRQAREEARARDDEEEGRLAQAREELLARQEMQQEERRRELERQWEEANPQNLTEAREFQIDRLKDHVDTWRDQAGSILGTGQVAYTDPITGEIVQRPATEQEMRDAQIRMNLIDNFDQRMKIEGTNQIARLEVAQGSAELISRPTFAHDTIPDPRNVSNEYQDSYDISDLRNAGSTTGDSMVDSLEERMLTQASRDARTQIDEGTLVGMVEVAKGTLSFANFINPADTVVGLIAGVETMGPNIGEEKSRVDILAEGIVEVVVGTGVGISYRQAMNGTGTSGSRRGGPQLPSEADLRGLKYTNDSSMARGTDVGGSPTLQGVRTGSGSTEVLRPSDTLQGVTPPSRAHFGDSPRSDVQKRTPEEIRQMTNVERQAYHDARASRQAAENWRRGESLGHLNEPPMTSPDPQTRLMPRKLTPAQQEELLQRRGNLSRQELIDKAEILAQRERARREVQGASNTAESSTSVIGGAGQPADWSEGATILDNPLGERTGSGSTEVLRPSDTLQGGTPPSRTPSSSSPAIQQPLPTPAPAETPITVPVSRSGQPETDIQLLDSRGNVVPESALRREAVAGRELDTRIRNYYKDRTIDPLHTTTAENLELIRSSGSLTTGDVVFSPRGVGPARRGGEAIRVRLGSEDNVHFIETPTGLAPKYYEDGIQYLPDGSVDLSKGRDYIPTEHLEYFDRDVGRWQPFE